MRMMPKAKSRICSICVSLTILMSLILVSFSHASTLLVSFKDENNDVWSAYSVEDVNDSLIIYNPKQFSPHLKFYKNGIEEKADARIQYLFMKSIAHPSYFMEQAVGTPAGGDTFNSNEKYWAIDCGFLNPACAAAKVGFSSGERREIYKKLIYNAVTSADVPFLLGESYVVLSDGTHLLASSFSRKLGNAIEKIGMAADDINDTHDAFEKVVRLISLNPSAEIPDVYGINELAGILSEVAGLYSIGLNAYQYILLRDYVANAQMVRERLDFYEYLVDYLRSQNVLDSAFESAVNDVAAEILLDNTTFKQKLIQDIISVNADTFRSKILSFVTNKKFILSVLKRYEMSFTLSSNISNTVKKLAPGVGSLVSGAISGYNLYSSSVDHWRTLFISYTMNRQMDMFRYSGFYKNAFQVDSNDVISYETLNNEIQGSYLDIIISLKKSYYDEMLSLVDSKWPSLVGSLASSFISTMSSPQLYALHFSAPAINFGSELSKSLSTLIYSADVQKAKKELSDFIQEAVSRNKILNDWSSILISYNVENPVILTPVNNDISVSLTSSHSTVNIGTTVTFTASYECQGGCDDVRQEWRLVKPDGSSATLGSQGVGMTRSFTPDVPGAYSVQIKVYNGIAAATKSAQVSAKLVNPQITFEYEDDQAHVYLEQLTIPACVNNRVHQIGSFTVPPGEVWSRFKFAGSRGDFVLIARKNAPPEWRSGWCGAWEFRGTEFDFYEGTRIYTWDVELLPGDTLYLAAVSYEGISNYYINSIVTVDLDLDNDGVPDDQEDPICRNDPTETFDTDGDGVGDNADKFDNDPAISVDADGDGYPDSWNPGHSLATSVLKLPLDMFPENQFEHMDSDGDGMGDGIDTDDDNDGVADGDDFFDLDPAASLDSDRDGHPDAWNAGFDLDGSQTTLRLDAFPQDHAASLDSDADGSPDCWNFGKSQQDSTSGLLIDAFPIDPAASLDSDFDGYPDCWNPGWSERDSTTGLVRDQFPFDSSRWGRSGSAAHVPLHVLQLLLTD